MNTQELPKLSCNGRKCREPQTKMFKRLLVAVDNSEQSGYAVIAAARLASQLDAHIILTHICVLPPSSDPQIAFIMTPDVYTVCMVAGEGLLETVKASLPASFRISTDLRQGDPTTEILEAAHVCDADLIVMGTHARGRLAQALLGSVARAVTQMATCPVLTVAHPLPLDDVCRSKGNKNCKNACVE